MISKITLKMTFIFILTLVLFSNVYSAEIIHHNLTVHISPARNLINGNDCITLPKNYKSNIFRVYIHKGLNPEITTKNAIITLLKSEKDKIYDVYKLVVSIDTKNIEIKFGGQINHPVVNNYSSGTISAEGASLFPSTYWYPVFDEYSTTFDLKVQLPKGWTAIGQGDEPTEKTKDDSTVVSWADHTPQKGIYLNAAKFIKYSLAGDNVTVLAYLRTKSDKLANRFLNITKKYITMYNNMIAPYPYSKFALVENFWETGYGMPSFTLLGPTVIKLPFILYSSYPHEILHNWWGNSVYVDYERGNWCEGITVYMADHYLQEQQGNGIKYRRTALKNFRDYVTDQNDFPLRDFRSRFSKASQAIGYGKGMMLFHMLKIQFGNEMFLESMRNFYVDNLFQRASFEDIQASFEKTSGTDLKKIFHQWVDRKSAPTLLLKNVSLDGKEKQIIKFSLEQSQKSKPYALYIPIKIIFSKKRTVTKLLTMKSKKAEWKFNLGETPVSLTIDPEIDVFRKLGPLETPPTLSGMLSENEKITIILPANSKLLEAYKKWAEEINQQHHAEVSILTDTEVHDINSNNIPSDSSIWFLGWDNTKLEIIKTLAEKAGSPLTSSEVLLPNKKLERENHSVILVFRNPSNSSKSIGWMASPNPESFSKVAGKIKHYGGFSFLGFEKSKNILKGEWEVKNNPLIFNFEKQNAR